VKLKSYKGYGEARRQGALA